MTPSETDAWARFVINFCTRAPEADRRALDVASHFVAEACQWARERQLDLDDAGRRFVEKVTGSPFMPNQQLSTTEPQAKQLTLFDLEALETKVKEGLAKFMEVGNALAEIRDREGYRLKGYKSFETYCEKEFGFSLRQGERLITASRTAEEVKRITAGDAPRNEAAARVLAPIAADEKVVKQVQSQLKRSGKSIATATAEKLQEVVDRVRGKPAPSDNGKDGKGKQEVLAPVPVSIAALGDECPNCHQVPNHYSHATGAWACGNCSKPVLVVVSALAGKACPDCGKPIGKTDRICNNCGGILK